MSSRAASTHLVPLPYPALPYLRPGFLLPSLHAVKGGLCYFKAAAGWTATPGNATSGTVVSKATPPVVEPKMSLGPGDSPGMSSATVTVPSPALAPGAEYHATFMPELLSTNQLAAEALLAQKDAIVNWAQFYSGNNMTG